MPLYSVKTASSEFRRFITVSGEGTVATYVGAYMASNFLLPTSILTVNWNIQFELFLYGLYTSLFSFCAYLVSLNRRPIIWPFVIAAVLMFGIATADIAVTLYYLFRYILNGQVTLDPRPKALFFITNKEVTFGLQLIKHPNISHYLAFSRNLFCYIAVISDGYIREFVLVFLGFSRHNNRSCGVSKALFCVYVDGIRSKRLPFPSDRNIYSARRARSILGSDVIQRYPTFSATFIESGISYSLYLLVTLVARSLVLDAGLNQVVGIVPTLIIIRISLRTSFRVETVDTSSSPVLDSIFSTVGTESQISPYMPRVEVGMQIPAQTEHAEHA
ncbi:hypothetical protein CPB84DRAFT_1843624 [Gymnopilus junonius]|uniref:Uncharacterized protein n=1 Tax=Gymnopilus junonius TaxID=109634 RepID=A0A9P5TS82_GYMJU|nr:hypothetical protein CPB84DRAFT_1843624 [Gymnopilus junonius]